MSVVDQIKETVAQVLPENCQVTKVEMEGPEVAIYTKNPKAFFENENFVAKTAFELKKRVKLRTDKSLLLPEKEAEEKVKEIVPEDASIKQIYFDPTFSEITIESIKPGLVIGKGGETIKRIILETGWTPNSIRAPTQPSEILTGIRHQLHKYSEERKKILQQAAEKIYADIEQNPKDWFRIEALGGFRQVGRSCIFLETPHTRAFLDCGIDVAGNSDAFPYLNILHFPLSEIDSVVVSHAHLDHSGFIPFLFKSGFRGPVYCTPPTRDLMTLLQFDYIDVLTKEGKDAPYGEKDVKTMLKYVIPREYREVTDIAPDMRLTLHNAAHILGSASVHMHVGEGAHNLVYSLDEKTPVAVFDKNDNLKVIEIGKLVNREITKFGIGSGFVEEASNFNGWKTISFNPKTLKSEMVEISSFIRHPINEDLFEINTAHGRKVAVTGSHSVFTVSNGIVKSVEAKELNIGDYIIGPKKMNLIGKKIFVSLPKNEFALKLSGKELEQQLKAIEKKVKKQFPEKEKELMLWAKDSLAGGLYEKAIAKKHQVSRKTIRKYFKELGIEKKPRVKNSFPATIELTKELARFLGYFVSEGSFNKNTVIISQYNTEILEDSLDIIKKAFGIEGKIVKKEAQFYSKQLALLLKKVLRCGRNAYKKRIPRQLALAQDEVIAEYLKGYFIGDGSLRIRKKGISINCTSKSKLLIQETGFLLLRLGITPTFEYNKYNTMHNLYVYGRNQVENFIEKIKITGWEKRLLPCFAQKIKSNFAERIPIRLLSQETQEIINKTSWQNASCCGTAMLMKISQNASEKALLESDLMLDEITSIKKIRPTGKFVYDLSVIGYENFLGGEGHLFLHNTGDIKYGFTRLFNNVDMHYPRIETMIIESTYGGKDAIQPNRQDAEERLLRIVKETVERDGNILIPVFAVGRGQEIMLVLENFYRSGLLDTKCYIDGMTNQANAIHTAYPEYLRKGVQRRILQNDSPFTAEIFESMNGKNRDEVVQEKGMIVIASSGMLTGGASLEYLYRMADNPNNCLIFVGYQGEGSLGRKIQGGLKTLPLTDANGKTKALNINMRIETIEGFSGHSDRDQLMAYVRNLKPKPKRIIINHGEKTRAAEFARAISSRFKINASPINNLDAARLK